MEYLLQRANTPFSIIFSNTCYFKGIKKRYYEVKGEALEGGGVPVSHIPLIILKKIPYP